MEIQLWRRILSSYELAVQELIIKFEHLIAEYRTNDQYSPIEEVSGRVKSISSILEKIHRKNIPMEKMEEEVEDIAGVRIICQFEEDIAEVARIIGNRKDMEIKSERVQKLPSDCLLYRGDYPWTQASAGGDSDPHPRHEFLGDH